MLLCWWWDLGSLFQLWGSQGPVLLLLEGHGLAVLPSACTADCPFCWDWGQHTSNAVFRAGFWCEIVHEIVLLQVSSFSASGMRCKMLELLQTHWWRTSSLCLLAFSWAQKTAFPLQLKQALTLHLDLQLQVCSLSGQHSSVEEMEQSWIQFILFKTWKNNNT